MCISEYHDPFGTKESLENGVFLGIIKSMKSSLAKKTSITLPAGLEEELKTQAVTEHRTLSGILQEAARYYLNIRRWKTLQEELAPQARRLGIRNERDVDTIVHQLCR